MIVRGRTGARRILGLLGIVLMICGLTAVGVAQTSESNLFLQTLMWNGIERFYGVYVPASAVTPSPLVFVLHGGGGSVSKVWGQEFGRSWEALADEHGFCVVIPQGRSDPSDPDGHHWNDCRIEIDNEDVATLEDDVGFIVELIHRAEEIHPVDRSRVYVTGVSNGGMMTYRLAIEASESFAAAAAVIANLPGPSECAAPSVPVPMLIMNGTEDPLMPSDGGCVVNERCQRGRVLSTTETVEAWVLANGASATPFVEQLPNRAWFDGSRVTVYRYEGEENGADVVHYRVEGGGHSVPGAETISAVARAISGPKNRDIDGASEIWEFFSSQVRDTTP